MRIALLLLVLSSGVLFAGDTNAPPRSIEVTVSGWSPLKTYYIEHHTQTPSEVMQVWLVSAKNPKDRRLLYTHSRSVVVLISDDEQWLVVNDYAGSDIANVLLFRQQHGLEYKQVEDLTDKAWGFVAAQAGRKKRLPLDHTYAEVLRWMTTIRFCSVFTDISTAEIMLTIGCAFTMLNPRPFRLTWISTTSSTPRWRRNDWF